MMKKILIYLFMVPAFFLMTGCEDWLDVNDNPNSPDEVPSDLILPAAEASMAVRIGGNMFNFGGFFAQYWTQAPEANQYNKVDNYTITAPFLDTDYTELYSGALNDLETIRTQALENDEAGYYFVATVLQAYIYQVWVDMMGDVPYSEALQGLDNRFPSYDDGETIYENLLTRLDEAEEMLGPNSYVASNDYFFDGDIDKWVAFANSLRLKIYMRASYAKDYSDEIMALINDDDFITEDVIFAPYPEEVESSRSNPWYATNLSDGGLGTKNNIASYPIVEYLKSKNDIRLSVLFETVDDEYVGGVPGMKEGVTSDYSTPIIEWNQPVYLYTMTELELFKSEAYVRFFNDETSAIESYNAAIDHSLQLHGINAKGDTIMYGEGEPYEWEEGLTQEEQIETIAMQKWVSLCYVNNLEAWFEMRRLGYPSYNGAVAVDVFNDASSYTTGTLISPDGNSLGDGNFLQRLPYPEESTRLNDNAPDQKDLTTPIWWDTK